MPGKSPNFNISQTNAHIPNITKRRALEELITLFTTECASVETNGLGYTTTTQLSRNMKWCLNNWPTENEKIMMHKIVDDLDTEWALLEDAS